MATEQNANPTHISCSIRMNVTMHAGMEQRVKSAVNGACAAFYQECGGFLINPEEPPSAGAIEFLQDEFVGALKVRIGSAVVTPLEITRLNETPASTAYNIFLERHEVIVDILIKQIHYDGFNRINEEDS
ncbi:hypothetical protein MGYG_08574 [Nannizzia gypsea CBS 118893]|uniref:Uncharacterized protein n=1 Tax=Arthroderma gypseum (strain ATCC MYA-4604 / CBS 118893) TaxID=535722 RepID=E4V633_ARTGP|nr:hypothetical protein MGYG_08574 [Nannizzia gypsea CBS 118893]EFR05558.1 hypothetical protein MGYG_08574 [Nannizzia gypsea CBS 118893]